MSATPYADEWRRYTRERLDRLGLQVTALLVRTGLEWKAIDRALRMFGSPLDFEVASIIDEELRKADARASARLLRRAEVVPVAVDLDPLTNCDVHFTDGVNT